MSAQSATASLSDDERRRATEFVAGYDLDRSRALPGTRDFFRELGPRAIPFAAPMLVSQAASDRLLGLVVLTFARPLREPRTEADTEFEVQLLLPLQLRSTYDADPAARRWALHSVTGLVLTCLHSRTDVPDAALGRLRELLQDPDADVSHAAAWFLYQIGERDLLTPEQIKEFSKGPVM